MSASPRERERLVLPLLILVSLLPHVGAVIPGLTYFFRDFTLTFYPLRLFQARVLATGRWPFWNPYIHEGTFSLPALYPLDLLHVLEPGPIAVSWLLTFQFPIAALACYALARDLGADRRGAFVSGAAYALGGLALSSLNLYLFIEALALAPAVVLAFRRAAIRGGRWIPAAGLALALSLTTLAVEFVAQGLLLGIALGLSETPRREAVLRTMMGLALGVGIAGVPVAIVLGILPESVRGSGFSAVQSLDFALPPVALFQVLVPGLFGSPGAPFEAWWGGVFFRRWYPYFATLYLGPLVLVLAAVAAAGLERRRRFVFLGLAALGLWYALGESGGLAPLLVELPGLRWFRYPSKALLLPYMVSCVLAGLGAERLGRGEGWRRFSLGAGLAAGTLLAFGGLVVAARGALAEWLSLAPDAARVMVRTLARQSLEVALIALAAVALAQAVRAGRVAAARAAVILTALLVLDLDLAGTGVNPLAPPAFFRLVPELAAERLDRLEGGRAFSYGIAFSPAMGAYLDQRRRGLELGAFFAARQVLAPYTNILDAVEVADGDRTSFSPHPPLLAPRDYDPQRVGEVLTRLRSAAVSRVLSVDPLDHPDLRLRALVPAGPPGLAIHVYELLGPWPRAYVACRVLQAGSRAEAFDRSLREGYDPSREVVLEAAGVASCREGSVTRGPTLPGDDTYTVESDGEGYLVTRDSYARGWTATVDGRPVPVSRANGRHRAVPVPPGRHEVRLRYRPPGLSHGLLLMALGCVGALVLWLRPVLKGEDGSEPSAAPPTLQAMKV